MREEAVEHARKTLANAIFDEYCIETGYADEVAIPVLNELYTAGLDDAHRNILHGHNALHIENDKLRQCLKAILNECEFSRYEDGDAGLSIDRIEDLCKEFFTVQEL